ncbi:sugar transferase [Candidatus Deferrimicrobium sp.]|uniref:sugar transferase n=1 Tax=Candidatus Deferrimicrobium sp. TaxID=3060586 RepID=UPI003C3B554C
MDAKIFNIVYSSRDFSSIIHRERDRSDRTGQGFSLVIFEVGTGKNRSDSVRNLVPILTHRVRSTDAVGWFEDGRIGVILPHTTTESAWKFVANVRNAFNGNAPPECVVYAYPSSWIPGDEQFPPQDSRSRRKTPGPEEIDASGSRSSCLPCENRTRPIDAIEPDVLFQIPLWKRAIDIAGSVLALILLSPLLLAVPILIKIVSPGPVLFRQDRVGYRGKVFTIWKFRTMHVNADATPHRDYVQGLINNENIMTKLDNGKDRRIIPFGNLLRATGIDELPQLINVFLGDMSLVGPRPCLSYEAQEFSPWQMRRFDAVPGLTGLWQVSGKNRTTFKEMMRLDIGYAKKRAFRLDMIIFLKTIPAIVRQVADRPSGAPARPKELSAVVRLGAVFFAFLAVNSPRK